NPVAGGTGRPRRRGPKAAGGREATQPSLPAEADVRARPDHGTLPRAAAQRVKRPRLATFARDDRPTATLAAPQPARAQSPRVTVHRPLAVSRRSDVSRPVASVLTITARTFEIRWLNCELAPSGSESTISARAAARSNV